ncbi:MAG: ABA4-like family protein [Anaerolineae bacterium]|nr:ABA4-like family protein [Anaerolineae bacterium]MCO5195419.1 ABA4-like family protein [Anaerolineae bacterium]MCO5198753.1 ABA4-like family protein [Anaerolineae bacterium]MCO5203574.1 ABA4-like family protein [Anaerolineae bacterium]
MQDKFFQLINLLPMPVWLAMMFAPNHKLTRRASRSSAIFGIMGLTYVTALIAAIHGGSSSETSDPAGGGMDFTSLDGIRRGLGTREGALAGWAHFLALDLFAGAWIYRQAQKDGAPAWVRIPALFFTLMTGPFGLLLFLIWRIANGKGEQIE